MAVYGHGQPLTASSNHVVEALGLRRSYRVQEIVLGNDVEPVPQTVMPKLNPNNIHDSLFGDVFIDDKENSSAYVGFLFAGRTEFNWVVRVTAHSLERKSQSYIAIGNLFSEYHVLTSCSLFVEPNKKKRNLGIVNIRYATMYLGQCFNHDDTYAYPLVHMGQPVPETGNRKVVANGIYIHPTCFGENHFDVAIATLDRGIRPAPPVVTLMPSLLDLSTKDGNIPKLTLSDLQKATLSEQSLTCYVASYGKPYLNWRNNYVQRYKVKYRAYPQYWKYCNETLRQFICNENARDPNKCKIFQLANAGEQHMCFTTRARTGSVCFNYDRGAPLVCGGLVYGVVVGGARKKYCSSRIQLPFIVLKITALSKFMRMPLQKDIFIRARENEAQGKTGKGERATSASNQFIPRSSSFGFLSYLIQSVMTALSLKAVSFLQNQ